jgi:hypothetical protein
VSNRQQENHQRFLNHLDGSAGGVWAVAQWLASRGHAVRVNPNTRAPHRADWREHVDAGDLEISLRIEVKHLRYHFTCAEDWPFGNFFIVCAKHQWDKARPRPYAYVSLNPEGTHAAIVRGDTFRDWKVEFRRDHRYEGGETQAKYVTALTNVKFIQLG